MESSGEMVAFPLLIENNYRACTIPYRFPSDNPNKPTPIEDQPLRQFHSLFQVPIPFHSFFQLNTLISFVVVTGREQKVTIRSLMLLLKSLLKGILEDFKKDPESHGGPPDCILLCRLKRSVSETYSRRLRTKKMRKQ